MSDYDDEMNHVFDEVTRGSDFKSEQGSRLERDPSDDIPVRPLCRQCVRDVPADGTGLCTFCQVVTQ